MRATLQQQVALHQPVKDRPRAGREGREYTDPRMGAAINPGLARFWKTILFANWLTRGKPQSGKELADMQGWSGAVNLVFTGEGGATWHCAFEPGRTWVRPGAHPAPRGTVRISVEDFFRLLAGQGSYATMLMLGDVGIEGEGLAGNVFWGILARVRGSLAKGGIGGWLARRWIDGVLARSGTTLALKVE